MNTLLEPMTEPEPATEIDAGVAPPIADVAPRTVLSARGLRKTFGGQIVLGGVDLDLRQGEVVLLRGENGSGKTTLLNIITGNLAPDSGSIQYSADDSPRIYRFPRRWWQELNPWDHFRPEFVANEGLGRTWQDIRLFGAQSLRDNIAVAIPAQPGENPIRALFVPGRVERTETEIRQKADAMLSELGLAGRELSSADKISLGQSKRVAIARAVAAGAGILFLDEPLAGLDRPGIRNVLDLLEAIVRDHSVTLIIVEHVFNLPQLAYLATADWLLKDGKLVCKTAPFSEQTIDRHVVNQDVQARPAWIKLLIDKETEVTDEALPRGATLTRISSSNVGDQTPILEIRDLIVQRGSRVVIGLDDERELSGFSFSLRRGEIAILHAPNGWGKTTLLETIAGLCAPSAGEVFLNGRSITKTAPWRLSRMGVKVVLSQNQFLPTLNLHEIAALGGVNAVPEDFESDSDRTEGSLSGGEKQRYRLQLALSGKPDPALLLLDEPFAGLDKKTGANIALKLKQSATRFPILIAHPSYQ